MDISKLLEFAVTNKASDLHISAGLSPLYRIDGDLRVSENPVLKHEDIVKMLDSIMNELQKADYKKRFETDFSFQLNEEARFRVNAFTQDRGAAAVFRVIPSSVLTMQDTEATCTLQYSKSGVTYTKTYVVTGAGN